MLCLIKHLHYWINLKKAIAKNRKGAAFWKQPLYNILFKMLYLQFIHIASSAGINKAIIQITIAYHVCVLFSSSLWH